MLQKFKEVLLKDWNILLMIFFHHPGQNLVEMPQIRVSWMIQQYFGNYFVLNEISIQVYSSINFFEKWATLKATKSLERDIFLPPPSKNKLLLIIRYHTIMSSSFIVRL